MRQKNFPFPVRSKEQPVLFHFHSLVVPCPFMIRSYSFQPPFEVCAHFLSISNPFYIRSVFAISLNVTVYDFYSLLKSVHAGQQFSCGRKKDSDSLTAPIQIVLMLRYR